MYIHIIHSFKRRVKGYAGIKRGKWPCNTTADPWGTGRICDTTSAVWRTEGSAKYETGHDRHFEFGQ